MNIFARTITFLLFGLILITSCNEPSTSYDLIIQNGRVVDGTGAPAYPANIAILKDKIVKVSKENIDAAQSVKRIDAKGLIVSPGFIDIPYN